MEHKITELRNRLQNTFGEEFEKLYVEFCAVLIDAKEKGEIREEEAAHEMVGALFNDLDENPELEPIFNAAASTEIPREISDEQPMGQWDQKTADVLKQAEWQKLVAAVEEAKK